jgi:caspase domain-containing protein/putative peptidoglycan binding protein
LRYLSALCGVGCWALAALVASPADAKRVALVIGNADYKIAPLQSPVSDAVAVAEAIEQQLKFDKVILKRDLGAQAFRDALRELAQETRGAELGVLYFAGHGVEVGGRNFLIPIDARLTAARDVELEAIALETVLAQLDGVSTLKLVILDACRNNPFPLAGGTRSVGVGLARIEPEGNTLVAYAARHGTMADDGPGGGHSPFTEALLRNIAMPGLDVRQLFGYVRDEVVAATGQRQQPYVYGTLGGQGIFLRPQIWATAPIPLASPQPSEAERAWAAVKDTDSIAQLEVIAARYKGTVYGDLALARIEELRRKEDAKLRLAGAVPPPASAPVPPLAQQLQAELQRVGCSPGVIDGLWSDKAKAALARFARHARLTIPTGEPTLAALEAVKAQEGRICPLECGPGTVEKDGRCVAKAAPDRSQGQRDVPRYPKRAQQKERDSPKPKMCWARDGRAITILPCDDPRATTPAY